MTKSQVDSIITDFKTHWTPESLGAAENLFGRFLGGEYFYQLAKDFNADGRLIATAIRFFILYRCKNKRVVRVYQEMQGRRVFEK